MKKILTLVLVLALCLGIAACAAEPGQVNDSTASSIKDTTPEKTQPNEENAGVYTVDLMMPTTLAIPSEEAKKAVEDAINTYLSEKLGITDLALRLTFQSRPDYATVMNLQLAGGEKMDLVYAFDLVPIVSSGYLLPLDDYMDNELAGAKGVLGDDWLLCGTVNNSVYAIPSYKGHVLSFKYIYNKDTVGDYDMSQVKSIDDLDALFAYLKKQHPDDVFGAYTNQYHQLYAYQTNTAQVATYFAVVGDNTQLVNYFETEAFRKGIEKAYEHRQLGYVDPEGSANTLSHDALVLSGACKGVIMGHAYTTETVEQMFDMNNTYGASFGAVEISRSILDTNLNRWGIAYTSENPSAAARMMNVIWTDEFVMSTLIYGLEGQSWRWNADHTSIEYPDGLSLDTVPYTVLYTCGSIGNQFNLYPFDGNTSETDKVFMKEIMDEGYVSPLFGFVPDSKNVTTQLAAVSNVYNQYFNALAYGDVDPEAYLPEFLDALKTAGIDEIMAEYQTQVDNWVAANK